MPTNQATRRGRPLICTNWLPAQAKRPKKLPAKAKGKYSCSIGCKRASWVMKRDTGPAKMARSAVKTALMARADASPTVSILFTRE